MRTILLIDDEELILRAHARLFQSWGWEVLTATSAEAGIAMLDRAEIVVTDYSMPITDGSAVIEACAKIGKPVVLYTSDDQAVHKFKVSKSAKLAELIAEVENALLFR